MRAKDSQELKQLQTRKIKLEVEIEQLNTDQKQAQKDFAEAKKKLDSVDCQIKALKVKNIVISEHAILRFLERKFNLDLEDIEAQIMSKDIEAQIKAMGNGKYPVGGGLRIVVKDGTIVSVIG